MSATEIPTDHVDVLIVGAGPAGLMMGLWMSRCGIRARIVDKRPHKVLTGQAAGLQCRTQEIFDSFLINHLVRHDANHLIEICLWETPMSHTRDRPKGHIHRAARIPDTVPNISRFQQVNINQGRIEQYLLDAIKKPSTDAESRKHGRVSIDYAALPVTVRVDEKLVHDSTAHPITVSLRHLNEIAAFEKIAASTAVPPAPRVALPGKRIPLAEEEELSRVRSEIRSKAGTQEVIKAKYMIGADGAHSWVRDQLRIDLEGDSSDCVWGVLDIIPITDFPDIRTRCVIRNADEGNIMIIPREDKLVRIYTQLTSMQIDARVGGASRLDRSEITADVILRKACTIMRPYTLDYCHLDWWTTYQIGQRVGTRFSFADRVFLAGDAVHTHSPKAGQGLNVSLQDTYNLGWKLAGCIKGYWTNSLLATYESERRKVAQDLIDFDFSFSKKLSQISAGDLDGPSDVSIDALAAAFHEASLFASGLNVQYRPNDIVKSSLDRASNPSLATKITVGRRIPSFKILSQADARPWHLQERLTSNGAWRVVLFTGSLHEEGQRRRLQHLGVKLGDRNSFLKRFTPATERYDSVIELLLVHAGPRQDMEIHRDFPEVFRRFDERTGWEYYKIFVDDDSYHEGHAQAYENYGIDKSTGCGVILRPDQHVSWVGSFDDYEGMDKFFSGFMVEQGDQATQETAHSH